MMFSSTYGMKNIREVKMKFNKTISKNFKILFRMKTSLIAVILGPLLVIFLIGLAFNSSSNIQLSVGYVSPDNSSLSQEFVTVLENENYVLQQYTSQENCVQQLERGLLHTCISFPKDFVIRQGKTNEITFIVDKSRLSIVYTVIESVSEKIGIKSEQLSKSLTETLTQVLSSTATSIDSNIATVIQIRSKSDTALEHVNAIKGNIDGLALSTIEFPVGISSQVSDIQEYNENLIGRIHTTTDEVENNVSAPLQTIIIELDEYASSVDNSSLPIMTSLTSKINTLDNSIQNAQTQISSAKSANDENKDLIQTVKTNVEDVSSQSASVKKSLEDVSYDISSIEITSSEQIVNPVSTTIETISTDANQLVILFPYVLILIIMFIGMLLSATLVVVEKRSKAAFRVFTTPTKDEYFILTTFITAFIVIAAQIAITLLLTNIFFINIFSENLAVNCVLLAIASSLFIMIGMAIGYSFSNQQGANMASISIGAILLFISNMILPIESVAPQLQKIAEFNPYVLSSELLRQSILFKTTFSDMTIKLLILFGYAIVILILIVVAQKISKSSFFKKKSSAMKKTKKKKEKKILSLQLKEHTIIGEHDFIIALNKLSDEEYNEEVLLNGKAMKKFVRKVLKKPKLAKEIKKKSRRELLVILANDYKERFEKLRKRHQELQQ